MLSFFTYPHQVTKCLIKLGWNARTLPPVSNIWLQLIHALRKNGIPPKQAAAWLDNALQGDLEAIQQIHEYSGAFGLLYFGTIAQAEQNQHMFRCK